ncbi:MAG: DUF1343 domain-containing protein [Myxococcales bacterium]|nr:DUF1343 domain-containing protein [Myxococcales bacterium]MCB9575437.1 DUF1343 domain-containing protein [Polyangiaceae bacterium]
MSVRRGTTRRGGMAAPRTAFPDVRLRAFTLVLALLALTDAPRRVPARVLSRSHAVTVPLVALPAPEARLGAKATARIDALVQGAIADGRIPGCVVIIGRRNGVVFRRAYGERVVGQEAMTADTVFDLASLTKAVVTTTLVLQLREHGALALDEPVRRWLPELGASSITVRQLLTHSSGLPADNALERYEHGHLAAIAAIARLAATRDPGTRYEYSDLGFILLGELVERVSKRSLDDAARSEIFEPLGMNDTAFGADPRRSAPTEGGLRGSVHDPRAARLGGVAGHAGLFSTADDLARFARYLLGARSLAAHPVLARGLPRSIVSFGDERRGLGWDVPNEPYALGVSPSTFGHTGFTGTALWIDPERDAFIVFLSSRLHPKPHGKVQPLVWQLFAAAGLREASAPPAVLAGIDVLVKAGFAPVAGAHIGLVTHAPGRARDGRRTLDLLAEASNTTLVAAFSLEHGLSSDREGPVPSGKDPKTGVPVFSLYGATRRPTPEMLEGIDTLVIDVQDVGSRIYTYASSMLAVMEVAAARGLRVVVLDRPNPIDGVHVEGPVAERFGFVNPFPLPVRHGLTLGELARLFRGERHLPLNLQVIPMEGWHRAEPFDETGLPWVNLSPNIRSPTEALLYAGVGLLERTNLSVGRGTGRPFEWIGAPWLDARAIVQRVHVPGVQLRATEMVPTASPYSGKRCQAVSFHVTDVKRFRPVALAFALRRAIAARHPSEWNERAMDSLVAAAPGQSADALAAFERLRRRYRLYP